MLCFLQVSQHLEEGQGVQKVHDETEIPSKILEYFTGGTPKNIKRPNRGRQLFKRNTKQSLKNRHIQKKGVEVLKSYGGMKGPKKKHQRSYTQQCVAGGSPKMPLPCGSRGSLTRRRRMCFTLTFY